MPGYGPIIMSLFLFCDVVVVVVVVVLVTLHVSCSAVQFKLRDSGSATCPVWCYPCALFSP